METTADPEEETMARMTSGEEFEYFLEKINKDHQV